MIYRMMLPDLRGLDHEECWVIFLNRAHFVLSRRRMSSGGLDATVMDIKQIMRTAMDSAAQYIVLVHNHPSGNPTPGRDDCMQTEALRNALATVEISLLDHVVVAEDSYYSFLEERVTQL